MVMYNVSEFRRPDAQTIDSSVLNSQVTNPNLDQSEVMYNEGIPEFIVDQNFYYPAATNYGYYSAGFESPGEWEDQNRSFGLDASEIQFVGLQNESMPYVYYTHSYGYAQSPFNPYNPYIPGAMVGVERPLVGAQQYYTVPPYQNPVSSPAYVPLIVQPDINPSNPTEYLVDVNSVNTYGGRGQKHDFTSASIPLGRNSLKVAPPQSSSLATISEGSKACTEGKQPFTNGSVSAAGYLNSTSSSVFQDSGSKFRPRFNVNKALGDVKGTSDALFEQNRGPRTSRLKNQLMVKAYATKTGDASTHGNIIIYADQYNRDDFFIDYKDAKFFVIKSYSEDDVHKSIKYNVWSSTPHGNKKLDSAYDDSQRITGGKSEGCPIFLFFSVNASGQFCGVAEMVGPVDFGKDMDFWQQDKWSGSFPVKWHIIKDVSNTSFRHIILENNENKPVTNSRDTQEILFKEGREMLRTFKTHPVKTSILDDFVYYENRQKIMQEEKTKLLARSYERPVFVPAVDSRKLSFVEFPPPVDGKVVNHVANSLKQLSIPARDEISSLYDVTGMKLKNGSVEIVAADKDNYLSTLKIGALAINPRHGESNLPAVTSGGVAKTEAPDVLTVGSMPVKVNGHSKSSGILKFGTVPLASTPLHSVDTSASKNGS